MNQIALGQHIKAAREQKHMTQEDLAAAVNYSVDHMSVIERGVKTPKLEKLIDIANVLGVGTDYLLQDDVEVGAKVQASILSESISSLPVEKQRTVMKVLQTLINELK